MDHIGIEVHKRESQIYILAEGGEVIKRRIRTEPERFGAVLGTRSRAGSSSRHRKPYSLRHTCATLLLSQGQTPSYVASQLGHSSPVMTMTRYAKFLPRERREAPARFEALLAAARETVRANAVLTYQAEQRDAGGPA